MARRKRRLGKMTPVEFDAFVEAGDDHLVAA